MVFKPLNVHQYSTEGGIICCDTMAGANLGRSFQQRSARHSVIFNGYETGADGVCRYEILVFDGTRQWSIFRRYREFCQLQAALDDEALLALPAKSWLRKRVSQSFCSHRYDALESWLKAAITLDPTCERSPELYEFLHPEALSPVADLIPRAMKHVSSDVSTHISNLSSTASLTSTDGQVA